MKRIILILTSGLLWAGLSAQIPAGISYQAVIRDGTGNLIVESEIGMRISIIQGSETGTIVYSETHETVTNKNGLAGIVIGSGETVTGDLETIVWSEGPFFVRVEIDADGGSEYVINNVSQILSVPYAFYSQYAGELSGEYTETQDLADVLAKGNMANAQIKHVSDPTDPQDAVTKKLLDTYLVIAGFAPFNFTGAVSDTDHNTYRVITAGSQQWMAENLRTTRLNDGTEISLVTGNVDWSSTTTPAYCWYGNAVSNSQLAGICGALYNWYTVDTRKLCPLGWHVPEEADFQELVEFAGGETTAGGLMKENGTKNWNVPNTGATNETGFSALPAGMREFDGAFIGIGNAAIFWTSKNVSADEGSVLMTVFNSGMTGADSHDKNAGLSVRCVKD